MPKKQTFEEALIKLKEIVAKLEQGDISLEESIKLYEEGAKLSAFCYTTLEKAEQKITVLSNNEVNE
ncbi:MAG: exodeoxyribonuclease VII small subunit [Clostridia bacterium]|nr:exodeoxyribonuclease VII small subunit [Clostridia bacterium]